MSDCPADVLALQVTEHGRDARVVTVTGEVDVMTAPQLAACVIRQLTVAQRVVVNLDGVRLLSSAGLSVLFEAHDLATCEDRDLRIVCRSRTASLALEVTGLHEQFTFADTVDDALNTR